MDPNDDIVEFVDLDSGMGSLTSSKDDTPESKSGLEIVELEADPANRAVEHRNGNDSGARGYYDDEPDETFAERLWGLTEMFPEYVRNTTYAITTNTREIFKVVYSFTRSVTWVLVSSSVILFAPIIFEVERAQMEEMQRMQQKQMLFGPPPSGMPAMPPPSGMPAMPSPSGVPAMPPLQR